MNSTLGSANRGLLSLSCFLYCILVTTSLEPSKISKTDNTYYPALVQMKRLCGKRVKVNRAMKIGLLSKPSKLPCTIYISPDSGNSVMATFVNYDFRKSYKRCEEHVQVCVYSQCFFEEKGYCESTRPTDVYDLDLNGSLTYESEAGVFNTMTFTVLLTEVHIMKHAAQSQCDTYSLFDCNTSAICIDKSLVCNHNEDCVNGKDEMEQCWAVTISTLVFVSFLIFVPGMLVAGIHYYYMNKKHRDQGSSNYRATMGFSRENLSLLNKDDEFLGMIIDDNLSGEEDSSYTTSVMTMDASSLNAASSGDESKMSAPGTKIGLESPMTTSEHKA